MFRYSILRQAPKRKPFNPNTQRFVLNGAYPTMSPQIVLPSRQSHLRSRNVIETVTDEEVLLKHNAFNLVMKLLYGKLDVNESMLQGSSRLLRAPPASAGGSRAPLTTLKGAAHGFQNIRDAGAFAKDFLKQQKELWYQYDVAMSRLEFERTKGKGPTTGMGVNQTAPTGGADLSELLSKDNATVASYFRNHAATAGGAPHSLIHKPPSYLLARLYKKRAQQIGRLTAWLENEGDVSVLTTLSPREQIIMLMAPTGAYAHGLHGCKVFDYTSFTDMLTHHGKYFASAEDLYVASHFATTSSRTLPKDRLAAMRAQYREACPSMRYLYAPPGMLVRGYASAVTAKGKRVLVLEPEANWISRCRADVLNFERFCLAKVSATALYDLSSRITRSLQARKTGGIDAVDEQSPDTVLIMDLFLQYRGLPTGRARGDNSPALIPQAQKVADAVTMLYNKARFEPTDSLPTVAAGEGIPIAELDKVLNEGPSHPVYKEMGLLRPLRGAAVAAESEEVETLLLAYRQQTMFLRRHANAYSAALLDDTTNVSAFTSSVKGQPIEGNTGAQMAEEISRKAQREGMHAYDAVRLAQREAAKK